MAVTMETICDTFVLFVEDSVRMEIIDHGVKWSTSERKKSVSSRNNDNVDLCITPTAVRSKASRYYSRKFKGRFGPLAFEIALMNFSSSVMVFPSKFD